MKKGQLTSGENVFIIRVEHLVSLGTFCIALRNHFYLNLSHKFEEIVRESELSEKSRGYLKQTRSIEEQLFELIQEESIFKKLTKKEAENILKTSLMFHGRYGEIEDTDYEASYERGFALNTCYDFAREWVIKKYPHLKPGEND